MTAHRVRLASIRVAGVAAILLVLLCASLTKAAEQAGRPNVVLIISDDHRWDAMGCAGNPAIHTPALDRLAREGVYFRQGTMHVPQCSPARAMLLTGLPPHQSGWYTNQTQRADVKGDGLTRFPMVPRLLKDAGYRTVLVGKWHLDAEPWDCGFTDVRVWHPGGAGPYGENPKRRIARGNSRERVEMEGFTNDLFGEDAAAFLKGGEAKDKPFLLWLALTAPHTPLTPNPDEVTKLYEGKTDQDLWPPTLPKDAEPNRLRDYYAAVSMADRQVGTVLSALDEAKLADNTIVVFIGDNGWMLGDKAVFKGEKYNGKVYPYEDSVRIPFLVRAPGNAQRTSDAAVSSLDLPPTILKAAGVTPPAEWTGRDMNALVKDPGQESTFDAAVCEFPDSENPKFGDTNYRLIRTKTHKLIRWADPKRPDDLFDLSADPEETKNLIGEASAKTVKDELNARLTEWMKKTNDSALEWKKAS